VREEGGGQSIAVPKKGRSEFTEERKEIARKEGTVKQKDEGGGGLQLQELGLGKTLSALMIRSCRKRGGDSVSTHAGGGTKKRPGQRKDGASGGEKKKKKNLDSPGRRKILIYSYKKPQSAGWKKGSNSHWPALTNSTRGKT